MDQILLTWVPPQTGIPKNTREELPKPGGDSPSPHNTFLFTHKHTTAAPICTLHTSPTQTHKQPPTPHIPYAKGTTQHTHSFLLHTSPPCPAPNAAPHLPSPPTAHSRPRPPPPHTVSPHSLLHARSHTHILSSSRKEPPSGGEVVRHWGQPALGGEKEGGSAVSSLPNQPCLERCGLPKTDLAQQGTGWRGLARGPRGIRVAQDRKGRGSGRCQGVRNPQVPALNQPTRWRC